MSLNNILTDIEGQLSGPIGGGVTGINGTIPFNPFGGGATVTNPQGQQVANPINQYPDWVSGLYGAANGFTNLFGMPLQTNIPGTNITTGQDTNAAGVGLKAGSTVPSLPWLDSVKLILLYAALFVIILIGIFALVEPSAERAAPLATAAAA